MRRILFLDFDGVLHGNRHREFAKLGLFEHYLEKMPKLEIVISSSWREQYSLDELKALFNDSIREQIIGITPILDCGFDHGGRQQEIETFLFEADLHRQKAFWIALDDLPHLFMPDCPYLTLVDPESGFTDDNGRTLLDWYARSCSDSVAVPVGATEGY